MFQHIGEIDVPIIWSLRHRLFIPSHTASVFGRFYQGCGLIDTICQSWQAHIRPGAHNYLHTRPTLTCYQRFGNIDVAKSNIKCIKTVEDTANVQPTQHNTSKADCLLVAAKWRFFQCHAKTQNWVRMCTHASTHSVNMHLHIVYCLDKSSKFADEDLHRASYIRLIPDSKQPNWDIQNWWCSWLIQCPAHAVIARGSQVKAEIWVHLFYHSNCT